MKRISLAGLKLKWVLVTATIMVVIILLWANLAPNQKELKYKIDAADSVESAHFEKVLGDLMGPAFTDGNQVTTFLNGDQIFPAMLQAIASTQHTITFESYIYWSGQIGNQFVEALCERARNGVKVHVLIDWVGSEKIDPDFIQRMQKAGVEIERYHEPSWYNLTNLNNRTHRKILVIDGLTGFTGGVGIADDWNGDGMHPEKWRDTHYRLQGPVVAQMQAAFLDNWMKVRPEIHQSKDYFPEIIPSKSANVKAQMFKSSTHEGSSSVHIMYLLAIASAKTSIALESAYFVPDDVTIEEIIKARKRGVLVEIIVPGKYGDAEIVRQASRETWDTLIEAGVHVYEYLPAMFHCKVLVVDNYFVSIGSTNFDERSFSLNDEANLNALNSDFAAEQLKIFEKDKSVSREVQPQRWKDRPFINRVKEKLAGLFSSQL